MNRHLVASITGLLAAILLTLPVYAQDLGIVATTTIIGDVVQQVAGTLVSVRVLFPPDADPHGFQPTPMDVIAISSADTVFVHGASLETGIEDLLSSAAGSVVTLTEGQPLRFLGQDHAEEDGHARGDADPHVWFDPTYVMVWTRRIEETLTQLCPEYTDAFKRNASAYRARLAELDLWIWGEVARIPREQRRLVTDHRVLGYFAARYGFDQIGAVLPTFSTLVEPSAKELANLEEAIRSLSIPAIFVGTTVNPVLAESIAADTGVAIVKLHTGSLSEAGGPADTYLDLMRHDVTAIVSALETP